MRIAVSPLKHHYLVGYAIGAKMGSIIHWQDQQNVTSEDFQEINRKIIEKEKYGYNVPSFNVVSLSYLGQMEVHDFGSYEDWEVKESRRNKQC